MRQTMTTNLMILESRASFSFEKKSLNRVFPFSYNPLSSTLDTSVSTRAFPGSSVGRAFGC
jgi:hypothetical protein